MTARRIDDLRRWTGKVFRQSGTRLPVRVVRCVGASIVLGALLGTAVPAAHAQKEEDSKTVLTPREWQQRLRQHTDDFATARLKHHQALERIEQGDVEGARTLLDESSTLDPRFDQAHRTRAALELGQGRITGSAELFEAAYDRFTGYRNQSLAFTNLLLTIDAALLIALFWCTGVLLIRYLPFLHHRLSQWVLDHAHRHRRANLLWPAIAAPLLALATWGIVPAMALAVPLIWVHGDRRPRLVLGALLGLLSAQALWVAPTATIIAGTDPTQIVSIVERAAYEPPTEALLSAIRQTRAEAPEDADLLMAEGLLLARRGDFEASSEALLENLHLRPDDVASTNNLAANHFFTADIDKAVAGFQRAAALDSTRAAPYYNLSQAYMKKLYLKEGGIALQQAMRRGFALTEQVERLPRGAVYFLRPSVSDFWHMAWKKPGDLGPLEILGSRTPHLGVPAPHFGLWIVGIFAGSVLLGMVVPRKRLVFECANCGALACRHCRGEHEGAVLCTNCANTARRAKSEMVLNTLLRNRRRDAESRYLGRLRGLDAWLFGAGALTDGVRRRGVFSVFLVSLAAVAIWFGGAPLVDPWDLHPRPWMNIVRVSGALLLLVTLLVNTWGRVGLRTRHLQPHPSSAVSLANLIEGRPSTRPRLSSTRQGG